MLTGTGAGGLVAGAAAAVFGGARVFPSAGFTGGEGGGASTSASTGAAGAATTGAGGSEVRGAGAAGAGAGEVSGGRTACGGTPGLGEVARYQAPPPIAARMTTPTRASGPAPRFRGAGGASATIRGSLAGSGPATAPGSAGLGVGEGVPSTEMIWPQRRHGILKERPWIRSSAT